MRIASIRGLLVPALLTLAVALAACGGTEDTGASRTDQANDADTARLKLTRCMRENGVDVPDRAPGQGGTPPRNIDPGKLEKAMEACAKYREEAFGNITDEQREGFRDAFVKFAACMRENGVDMPDPMAGGGPGESIRAVNSNDPKVRKAMEACQDKLPRRPGAPR